MKRIGTCALRASVCTTLIICLGCTGPATLSDFLGADLISLFANGLDDSGRSSAETAGDDPPGHDINDDNGGDRPDGVSDDAAGDDNGGDRPDGVSDDTPVDNDRNNPGTEPGAGADVRIEARLTGDTAASGHAEFRREAGRRKFKVEVEDFPAGIYGVFVNGKRVAEIEVGVSGLAEIEFDSKIELGHVPFPSEFPQSIDKGDIVRVGELVEGKF